MFSQHLQENGLNSPLLSENFLELIFDLVKTNVFNPVLSVYKETIVKISYLFNDV